MKYRVIDRKTKEDITDREFWVIRPNGSLGYMEYNDFIGYEDAVYIPECGVDMLNDNLAAVRRAKK